MRPTCYIEDCDQIHHAQGLCKRHYNLQRKRAQRDGTWESVMTSSDPLKTTVQQFLDAGYNYSMLEAISGVERNTFVRLFTRDRQVVSEENLKRVRRVPLVPLHLLWRKDIGIDYMVPTYLASRRIRALMAKGWLTTRIAEESGLERRTIQRLAFQEEKTGGVLRSTLVEIDRVYNELWDQEPPMPYRHSDLTRYRKWPLPIEWDDEELDDPDSEPEVLARARRRWELVRRREYMARVRAQKTAA